MHCPACSARVAKALKDLPGVQEAEVSLETNKAKVTYIPGEITPEAVQQAVTEAGVYFEGVTLIMTDQTHPEKIAPPAEEAIIHVGGMHCAACVARVEKTLQAVPGVQEAVVNLATREAQLKFDPERTDNSQFARVLEDAGYTYEGMVELETPSAASRVDPEVRAFRNRFLTALILNIPIFLLSMVHSLPHWLGLTPQALNYLLLALTTPVMFYAGAPFNRGLESSATPSLPI